MSKICTCFLVIVAAALLPMGSLWGADAAEQKKDVPKTPQEWVEQALKRLDANGDGQLTFDEFKGKRRKPQAVEKAEAIFKLIDRDGDLKLTLQEFTSKPAEARFKTIDRDNDGKLTWEEFKGQRKRPEQIERAEQNFKRMDKDGDRAVSLEEFKQGQPKVRPDKARIRGTWEIVRKNGDAQTDEKGNHCIFADGKMTVKIKDGETFELKYELDATKRPKAMDLVIEYEGTKYVLKGIYTLQRDTLTTCSAAQPDGPRPTEFKAEEDVQNVYVLKRVRKKK